jgi:hypothetical protein
VTLAAFSALPWAGSGGTLSAQQAAVRFEITSVSDTTLVFRPGTAIWVRPGQIGTAVDPRRRDQLVARFRIIGVHGGLATALVTGQTTAVSTDHVATLVPPRAAWYRSRNFWVGVLVGGALGAGASLASK